MNDATSDALHDDLVDLRDALEREDFSCAGEVLALHDRRMRQYIDTVGMQAPLLALRELLQLQHRIEAPPSRVPRARTLQ